MSKDNPNHIIYERIPLLTLKKHELDRLKRGTLATLRLNQEALSRPIMERTWNVSDHSLEEMIKISETTLSLIAMALEFLKDRGIEESRINVYV